MFQKILFKEILNYVGFLLNAIIFYRTICISNEIKQNSEKLVEISNTLLGKQSSFFSDEKIITLANSSMSVDEADQIVCNESIWELIYNSPYFWYIIVITSLSLGLLCYSFVNSKAPPPLESGDMLYIDTTLKELNGEKIEVIEKITAISSVIK